MKPMLKITLAAFLLAGFHGHLWADLVEMRNGDRYFGKVLSMSADTLVLQSEMLGKINVPRRNVTNLSLGGVAPAPRPGTNFTQLSAVTRPAATNSEVVDALKSLGGRPELISQVRNQMLATAGPEVNRKFDELVNGLATGQLNLNDIRSQAKSSADQLRAYKRELGPEAGDSLDVYLEILDGFLQRSANETVTAPAAGR
ncbi:MAG: hypothetical protein U1F65_04420 [Verrucomicrobiota bacterium]